MKEMNMDNPENVEEDSADRDEIRDNIAEHVHMFSMFLLALNDMGIEDALYIRDALFEMMTPDDDDCAVCANCGGKKDKKDTDPNAN